MPRPGSASDVIDAGPIGTVPPLNASALCPTFLQDASTMDAGYGRQCANQSCRHRQYDFRSMDHTETLQRPRPVTLADALNAVNLVNVIMRGPDIVRLAYPPSHSPLSFSPRQSQGRTASALRPAVLSSLAFLSELSSCDHVPMGFFVGISALRRTFGSDIERVRYHVGVFTGRRVSGSEAGLFNAPLRKGVGFRVRRRCSMLHVQSSSR